MKIRTTVAALAALGLVVAACGGDDDTTASDTTSEMSSSEMSSAEMSSAEMSSGEMSSSEMSSAEMSSSEMSSSEMSSSEMSSSEMSSSEMSSSEMSSSAGSGDPVCPSEIVVQTDWFPELEHGGTYQLIGPDGTADKTTVSYSGPVQAQYAVPGLETVTIKTVNFDKANASTLLDGDADMAYIGVGDIIKDSTAIPMVAIAKTLEKDPQMIMWDPAQHDINEPADIAADGAKVRHFPNAAYIDFMLDQGIMTPEQDDPNYNGSDSEFVALNGDFFQQGFATNEVYKYENDIAWKDGAPAPVDFFTVGDLGYDNYPAAITMTQEHAEELDACLQQLVPKMQQAWVDFLNDPEPIMNRMIEINVEHDGFWALSPEVNAAGFELLMSGGFAENSADGTYCSFDEDRVQELFDILKPLYEDQGTAIADSVDGLFTNEYCADAPGR